MNIFKYRKVRNPFETTHAKLKGFNRKIVQAEVSAHTHYGSVVSIESPLQKKGIDDNHFLLKELPYYGITLLKKIK